MTRPAIPRQPPNLECRPLPPMDRDCWESVVEAFRHAECCALRPLCAEAPPPDFRPARAWAGWREGALWVLAEMEDEDVFNPEQGLNTPFFQAGDTFEIFLRPEGQAAYFEFHIGPANQTLQLRIPSSADFGRPGRVSPFPPEWLIREPVMESRARVSPAGDQWNALAVIPCAPLAETAAFGPGARWRFSFCRYDYTRGQPAPVCSTTSPHARSSFHRQEEWGSMVFAGEKRRPD